MQDVLIGLPIKPAFVGMKVADEGYVHVEQETPTYELLFVRTGSLKLHVEGEQYTLRTGETILIRPNERYGGIEPATGHLHYYFIHFDIPRNEARSVGEKLCLRRTAKPPRPDRLTALFRLLLDDQSAMVMDSLASRLLVAQIIAEAGDSTQIPQLPASTTSVLMERCKAYIRQHSGSPLGAASIADALDVSPRYLGRAFRRAAGYSVQEFIAITRIHRSKVMIIETDLSIKQIARACGFESYSYFSRAFHKREGMSPREYRRLHSRAYAF